MNQIVRGQSVFITSYVTSDGAPIDITDAVVKTILKANARDSDAAALLVKNSSNNEVLLTRPAVGECVTLITSNDTNALPSYNTVYFEVIVKLVDGTIFRSGVDEIEVLQNVLRTVW